MGFNMKPEGAKPTVESCTSMVSRNRYGLKTQKTLPNSFKNGRFQTNGLQYGPEGAKTEYGELQQAWFQEIDVLKPKKHPLNSFKMNVSRPTGFNMNPRGQNGLWRVAQAWFQEIDVLRPKKTPPNSFQKWALPDQRASIWTRRGQNRLCRVAQA